MGEIIGRNIEVGLGTEVTRGTARTTAEKWFKFVSCNILEKSEQAVDDNSHGVLEDSDNRRVTKKWAEGTLEGIAHADALGYILYNIFGTDTESTLTTGVYQHIFSMAQSIQHGSLSIFVKDGSVQQKVFKNGMVDKLELSVSIDDLIRFTADFVAGEGAVNSDTTSYDTEYDFIAKDVTVKVADTEGGLGAATAVKIKELKITFEQGLIRDHVVGGYFPDDIYNSKLAISGSFTKNYEDTTFKDLYLNDSAKYMQITVEGEAVLGGEYHPKMVILLNKAMVTGWEKGGGNDELVTEGVDFKAFYNATDSEMATVTVQNKTSEFDTGSI